MAGPGKGDKDGKGGATRSPSTEKQPVADATTATTGSPSTARDADEARLFAELEAEERRLADERAALEADRERLEADRQRLLSARDEVAKELEDARDRLAADREEFERMLEQWRAHVEASRKPPASSARGPGMYRVVGPGSVMVAGQLRHAGEVLTLSEKDARSLGAAVVEE